MSTDTFYIPVVRCISAIQASLLCIVCREIMHLAFAQSASVRDRPGNPVLSAQRLCAVLYRWHATGQRFDGFGRWQEGSSSTFWARRLCQVLHNSDLGTTRETNRLPPPKSTLGPVVTWS